MRFVKYITLTTMLVAAACGAGEEGTNTTNAIASVPQREAVLLQSPATPALDQPAVRTNAEQCKARPLPEYVTKMVNADETSIAHWPGFAAIAAISPDGLQSRFFCGGVLANARTVITAAHCLDNARQQGGGRWVVKMDGGDWQLAVLANQDHITEDGPETRALVVGGATYREGADRYIKASVTNDIAYLKLDRDLPGPYGQFAGEPTANPALDRHLLWAAGFGQLEEQPNDLSYPTRAGGKVFAQSRVLRDAILPLVTLQDCARVFGSLIEDKRQICAGWPRSKRDTCYGDSGGPLVAIDSDGCPYVVGLTSFGSSEGCGAEGAFGVYTRVSNYRAWINTNAPGSRFTGGPPVAMGAEATSSLLRILIDEFAVREGGLVITILDRASGKPFPMNDGLAVVPVGSDVAYEVSVSGNLAGQVLLIDRKQNRTVANGQLIRHYAMIFPNRQVSTLETIKVEFGMPALIPGRSDFKIKATIDDPNAQFERGEVVALVLPIDIKVSELLAPADRTKGFVPEPASDGPKLITQLEAVSALLGSAIGGNGQAVDKKFGSAVAPYQIHRP